MATRFLWVALAVSIVVIVTIAIGSLSRESDLSEASSGSYTPQTEERLYSMPPSLVVIGDSYTGGSDMGGRGEDNWMPIMAKRLGYLPCSYAIGGSGWSKGRAGLTFGARIDWALSRDPDVLVFFNGVSDLQSDTAEVGRIVDAALFDLRAQNPNIPVVVISPVLVRDSAAPKTRVLADEIEVAAKRHNAVFVDPMAEAGSVVPTAN